MKHLIFGAVLLVLGLWGLQVWWNSFSFVIRALLPLALLVFGVVALLSSFFRAHARERDEEEDDRVEAVVRAEGASVDGDDSAAKNSTVNPEPQES